MHLVVAVLKDRDLVDLIHFSVLVFVGKSNLIDAICIAFGENALQLRAERLEDLVLCNVIGRSRSGHRCSVTLVFDDRDNNDSEASNVGE
jgi:chromosome segregation ATPase